MRKVWMLPLVFFMLVLAFGTVFNFQHRSSASTLSVGCIDIPANPDYISTGSAPDAVVAINNARNAEHLPPLRLPATFYQLDPSQQQFVLLTLERTDRGLKPLQMDA